MPCASILVRILEAVRTQNKLRALKAADYSMADAKKLGLIRPMPKYAEGSYDGSKCQPEPHEAILFRSRIERKDVKVADKIRQMAKDEEFSSSNTGRDVKMESWVKKRLKRAALTNDLPLSLVRFAQYKDPVGFKVCVDAGQNFKNNESYVFCITSLVPPGLFYRETPLTDDVVVTQDIDLDTTCCCPKW